MWNLTYNIHDRARKDQIGRLSDEIDRNSEKSRRVGPDCFTD